MKVHFSFFSSVLAFNASQKQFTYTCTRSKSNNRTWMTSKICLKILPKFTIQILLSENGCNIAERRTRYRWVIWTWVKVWNLRYHFVGHLMTMMARRMESKTSQHQRKSEKKCARRQETWKSSIFFLSGDIAMALRQPTQCGGSEKRSIELWCARQKKRRREDVIVSANNVPIKVTPLRLCDFSCTMTGFFGFYLFSNLLPLLRAFFFHLLEKSKR